MRPSRLGKLKNRRCTASATAMGTRAGTNWHLRTGPPVLPRIVRTSRHYRVRSPCTGLDRRGDPLHCRSRAGPQPLKCANGASAAWGTPTIDRILLLRGGSCVNGEKRLDSALPWPLATPKHKGPSAKPESPLLIPIRNTGYARQCTRTMRRPR